MNVPVTKVTKEPDGSVRVSFANRRHMLFLPNNGGVLAREIRLERPGTEDVVYYPQGREPTGFRGNPDGMNRGLFIQYLRLSLAHARKAHGLDHIAHELILSTVTDLDALVFPTL